MALKCRINNGVIEAPNGKTSELYQNLKYKLGESKALDIYALTETVEYKDALGLTTDKNGEMLEAQFLRFALETDSTNTYPKEALELSQKFTNKEISKLDNLYVEGIFKVTEETLKATGIFSQDEIIEVIYSPELQENIKEFIENHEEVNTVQPVNFKIESQEYNNIGIKPLRNPSEVQEEVITTLSKAKRPDDVALLVQTLPYSSMIEAYNTNPSIKSYIDELAKTSVVSPIEVDEYSTIERLYNTVNVERFGDISDTVLRIEVLEDKDLIIEEFEALVDSLISAGVEIDFDESSLYNKSVEELKTFSSILGVFVTSPTEATTKAFSGVIGGFTSKPTTKLITDFNTENLNKDVLRFFDSNRNEIEAFTENSLIKHSDGVYQKIEDKYSIEDLYGFLYNKISIEGDVVDISKLPSVEGSLEILRDIDNKEIVIKDIKNIVRENTKYLPFSDVETQEKIIIYKMFYGAPIDSYESNKVVHPVENQEFLEGDFISEFNSNRLSSKREQDEDWDNFYRHFSVDHKGIRLIYSNNFSIETVLANTPLGFDEKILIEYSKVSKHLDLGFNSEGDTFNDSRLRAQQNPETVKKLEDDYQISDSEGIITEETVQFLNLRGEVYEKALSFEDKSLYKKLPKGGALFANTNTQKPFTNKSPMFLRDFVSTKSNTVQNKKHLTKEELSEINQKHFECV